MAANAGEQFVGSPQAKATSKGAAIQMRAINLSGNLTTLMLPGIINTFTTGDPFGRPGTPFGAIDTGLDDKDGNPRLIDLAELVGLRRGARVFGLNALVSGVKSGLTPGQIAKNMGLESYQQFAHGWTGPALGAVARLVAGKNFFDLRGQMEAANIPQHQRIEYARAALESLNAPVYAALSPAIEAYYKHLGITMPPERGQSKPGPATALGERLGGPLGGYVGHILEGPVRNVMETFGGIKAGRLGKTAAEEVASVYNHSMSAESWTPEQSRRYQLKADLKNLPPDAQGLPQDLQDRLQSMVRSGEITPAQIPGLVKASLANPWALRLGRFPLSQVVDVLQVASPTEAVQIWPVVVHKYNVLEAKNPVLAASVLPELQKLAKRDAALGYKIMHEMEVAQ